MQKMTSQYLVILVSFLFLFLGCSSGRSITHENLTELMNDAFSKRDREALVTIEQKITDDYFQGAEGIKFLKDKVLLLSIIGDYESVARILIKGREIFSDNIEIMIALGQVEEIMHRDGTEYFQEAAISLKNISNQQKTSSERLIENYLLVLLNEHNTDYAEEVYRSLSDEERMFSEQFFLGESRIDLLNLNPISLVYSKPLFTENPGRGDEEWWLNLESSESQ